MTHTRWTLTVPLADNDGVTMFKLHDDVKQALIRDFGAYTSHVAEGAWSGGHQLYVEPVAVYTIDTRYFHAHSSLTNIALMVKARAAQDAVYLTSQPISTYLI